MALVASSGLDEDRTGLGPLTEGLWSNSTSSQIFPTTWPGQVSFLNVGLPARFVEAVGRLWMTSEMTSSSSALMHHRKEAPW